MVLVSILRIQEVFCLGQVIAMENGSLGRASISLLCSGSFWLPDPPSQTHGTFLCCALAAVTTSLSSSGAPRHRHSVTDFQSH